jgi:hypothetical protein
LQALRLNLAVGISDFTVYCFSHVFTETFEKVVSAFPTFIFIAQISAPGVEGTMSALGGTIQMLNMNILRAIIGIICNKAFFNITRESIVDYYKLAGIEIIGTVIPLLYMYKMIPSSAEIKILQDKQ